MPENKVISAAEAVALGVKPAEKSLILEARRHRIENGKIMCIIYYRENEMKDVEFEKVIDRVRLTK